MRQQPVVEADWREFKRVRAELLQRYCTRVLDEVEAVLLSRKDTPHDRYLRIYKLLAARDKKLANAFNDYRRSAMIDQMVIMRLMDLMTDDDLQGFSEDTRSTVLEVAAIYQKKPPSKKDPD